MLTERTLPKETARQQTWNYDKRVCCILLLGSSQIFTCFRKFLLSSFLNKTLQTADCGINMQYGVYVLLL